MTIREVVVTGQNQVELQTAELDAPALSANEVLIDTEYTFISSGTELANYTGREPKVFQKGTWCAYPWRSGYANVGIVREVGAGVTRTQPGARVFTYGRHASTIRYSQDRLIAPVTPAVEPDVVAASRMAGVAMTAIVVAEIPTNATVIVFGMGLVGNLAAQMFRLHGCRVIGVDLVEERRALAQRCGIEHTVGGTPDEAQGQLQELTNGELGHITVDAVGHSGVVMQALRATASHGQLIILGSPRVAVHGNLTDLLSDTHLRWITIRGALEWCVPMYPDIGNRTSQWCKQQTIFDWMARGQLHVEPLISHRLKPEQIKRAYDGLLNEPNVYTGVVLDWNL